MSLSVETEWHLPARWEAQGWNGPLTDKAITDPGSLGPFSAAHSLTAVNDMYEKTILV
jgi:hypothetical protein